MQEYKDGTFGEVAPAQEIVKKLLEKEAELDKTAAVHFGSPEYLEALKQEKAEVSGVVKYYGETLLRIEEKLDRIIKHFKIYPIIGE